MVYHRVLRQFDGKTSSKGRSLIANELYTSSEINRYNIPVACTRQVNIPKTQIYISFGARFQVGTDHNSCLD